MAAPSIACPNVAKTAPAIIGIFTTFRESVVIVVTTSMTLMFSIVKLNLSYFWK